MTPVIRTAVVARAGGRRRWLTVLGVAATLAAGLAAGYYRFAERDQAIKTLAVLPPRPLQPVERNEAVEVGATSILITRLGSLRQLIVRPENAVVGYARFEQDPLAAGREQKVDAVLDSRYQQAGDKFRFNLRLVRVTDGAMLWSDTLDQPTGDLFALQDALSAKVIGALRLTLNGTEKELLAKPYTNHAEAWLLYQRGRRLAHTRRLTDVQKAITYFQQALALDPGFALAYAELGHAYSSQSWLGQLPPREVMPKAKAAFDQALQLDDQLAEAHAYLAEYKHYYEWDFAGAELGHKRSLELNPNSADVRQAFAFHLAYQGRFEQAIPEIRKAEELDPTDHFIARNVAQVLFFARRYDEAIAQSSRVVDLYPNFAAAYVWMIRAYEMKGDEQGAFAAYLKQEEASGTAAEEITEMKAAFAVGGLKTHWKRILDRLLEREKRGYVPFVSLAGHYARLGERDQALTRLARAVEERNLYVVALNIEPHWDSYRADSRFVALVRRVGLAQ